MGESKISLFIASMGQTAAGLGVLWFFIVLFGGDRGEVLFDEIPHWAVFGVSAFGFVINYILLRKDRNLLLMIFLNLLLTVAGVWIFGRFGGVENKLVAAGLGFVLLWAQFCQLRWETKRFRDATMALQLQILILLAVCQIWLASQMGIEASWAAALFFFCLLLLCALVISKTSGLQAEKEKKGVLSKAALPAAAAGIGILLTAGTALIVEPVGNFFITIYAHLKGFLSTALYGFARVIQFLFSGSQVRLDEQAESSAASGTETNGEAALGNALDLDIFRLLFNIIMIGLAIVLAVGLIRLLLGFTLKSSSRRVRKGRGSQEAGLGFWQRLRAGMRSWIGRTRALWVLRRHPESIGALVVFLEKRCKRKEDLCRRPQETLREFLDRLSAYVKKKGEGQEEAQQNKSMELALAHLADAADRACYGRDGDLLDTFSESKLIRQFTG